MRATIIILSALGASLLLAAPLIAGPPYLTDDPDPVDFGHLECAFYGMDDYNHEYGRNAHNILGPAIDLNYGALPDTQLHLGAGLNTLAPDHGDSESGIGDVELGVKYRFVHETTNCPEISLYPDIELPTGDASRGLGNGRLWFRLPLWMEKNFGDWTTYGGGGAVINLAPGEPNYPFGGWMLQRAFGKNWALGGEIYAQGKDVEEDHGYVALNAGGSYAFNEHYSLLFSAGHSIAGDSQLFWYLGVDCTW